MSYRLFDIRHVRSALFAFIVAAMLASAFASSAFATAVTSYSGSDRYQTAALIADDAYAAGGSAGGVIIVSGENYPDALVASSVAGLTGYPVLLTEPGALSPQATAEIASLGAVKAIILGGTSAISAACAQQVADAVEANGGLAGDVVRIAGADRVETANAAYSQNSGWGSTAIICSSEGFADAESISPYAVKSKSPILLAHDVLAPTTFSLLSSAVKAGSITDIVIAGGASAVSAGVEKSCADLVGASHVTRLGGADRYETSYKVACWSIEHGMAGSLVAVASGESFPDALAGGPLQGFSSSVLLLVDDSRESMGYLHDVVSRENADSVRCFGGYSAVREVVRAEIYAEAPLSNGEWDFYECAQDEGYDVLSASFAQVVFVDSYDINWCDVYFLDKGFDGVFHEGAIQSTTGRVGENGTTDYPSEWLAATPRGLFDLPFAFGIEDAPDGTSIEYHVLSDSDWWCGDDSDYYNTFVHWVPQDPDCSEHMIDYSPDYLYSVVIGYNGSAYETPSGEAVYGAGSAFFLHVQCDYPTAGCVSVPVETMVDVLQWLEPSAGCEILID